LEKPRPAGADQWTHPWHGTDGGVVTDDKLVSIPRGFQWIHGPLFAMAGRKSSTQSLVSAAGRNFYVTQNVVENVNRDEKTQFLVARDAYNGELLWQRRWPGPFVSGNGEINPRIVAPGEHVYVGVFDGVQLFDAATGDPVAHLATPKAPTKILASGNHVLVEAGSGLHCFAAPLVDGAKPIWRFEDRLLSSTVVANDRALTLVAERRSDGTIGHDLVCLRMSSGETLWRLDTQPWTESRRVRINFANDPYVGLISHGHFHLLRLADGQHLWSRTTDARPGKDYVDERYVGHFYRHGLVWLQQENSPRETDGQATWVAIEPETGRTHRVLTTRGPWPRTAAPAKMGCQVLIASDEFLMFPRQATFVDWTSGQKHAFKFIRGGCGSGFVPANGLIYSHPHACGCFTEVQRGFLAVHSREPVVDSDHCRLESFAEAASDSRQPASDEDWPMYRRDPRRSGKARTALAEPLAPRWTTRVDCSSEHASHDAWRLRMGNPISAPVIANGTIYVCDVEGHQLLAVDDRNGAIRWQFAAGGRIDSPPTIYRGRCLFGAHDGYVYCLDATRGTLLWRYHAAPIDRRITAFGQLESVWPVAGTVLVMDNTAYVAAGRAPDADGGIAIHALDVLTGEKLWQSKVGGEMVGMCDYLVGGSGEVFLANCAFDARTGNQRTIAEDAQHLRGGKVGLLEASWTKLDLALRKQIQDWTANGCAGQLLAFDEKQCFGYRTTEDGEALLFGEGPFAWTQPVDAPRQIRALAATSDFVLIAGSNQRFVEAEGGFLHIHRAKNGSKTAEMALPSAPVFDGLAVARGKIYISLQDGSLISFGSPSAGS
jgi:outer membrane protein assembly factor BamB